MKLALIGHRGVGKTTLVNQLKSELEGFTCFDLDAEIESINNIKIEDIFLNSGEAEFRKLESEAFHGLAVGRENIIISCGAGFQTEIPDDFIVIWVRRPTDKMGRIFLNRPRLNPNVSALEEYQSRFNERELRYKNTSDLQITLPESDYNFAPLLIYNLGLKKTHTDASFSITVLPEMLKSKNFDRFKVYLDLNIKYFELRDDLLTRGQIEDCLKKIPKESVLLSVRKENSFLCELINKQGYKYDWALELGEPPFKKKGFLSLHKLDDLTPEQLIKKLERFEKKGFQIKLSLLLENLSSLLFWHKWWFKERESRSFLPRSQEGRFNWYRKIFSMKMPLNYMREGQGSALDQPTFFDIINFKPNHFSFGAVIGDPIFHSRTPIEHKIFFENRDTSVVAIQCAKDELSIDLLSELKEMGLSFLAVTSPLKNKMYDLLSEAGCGLTPVSKKLKSVNTAVFTRTGSFATNTDVEGLKVLLSGAKGRSVAVWGGGGTLSAILGELPQACAYSARTGQLRGGAQNAPTFSPDIIIWAIGRSQMSGCHWPPENWRPSKVIDLNYTADSPGIEYAQKTKAHYTSGLKMFETQATAQQEYYLKLNSF